MFGQRNSGPNNKKTSAWNPKHPLSNGCFNWMIPKIGVSQNGWFKMVPNPIKMDDLGVFPLFLETPNWMIPNLGKNGLFHHFHPLKKNNLVVFLGIPLEGDSTKKIHSLVLFLGLHFFLMPGERFESLRGECREASLRDPICDQGIIKLPNFGGIKQHTSMESMVNLRGSPQ